MKRILYVVLALAAFAGGKILMKTGAFSSMPSTKNQDYNVDLEKSFATGPKYKKGKYKLGTEEIPYDMVMNPDHTGNITLHLKDGSDSVINMTFELKGNTFTYHYTNAAGEKWDYTATINEILSLKDKVTY